MRTGFTNIEEVSMHRTSAAIAVLAFLIPLCCLAQQSESIVLVGVAVMENYAGRSVPGNVEQDRLVKAINQLKPDKKTHVKVQAVALSSSSPSDAAEEAQQKKCDYVVTTRLTELRTADDPYQRLPNTIETNPNSQWSNQNSRSQRNDPEFRATVSYTLSKAGGGAVSGAPFSTQESGTEIDTVGAIMNRIALQVVDQVKKAPPPMREQDSPAR